MGQRLNVEIIIDNEMYSNCYYHWSAYSASTIAQAIDIINEYKKIKASKIKYDNVLLSYKLLHLKGDSIDYTGSNIDTEDPLKTKIKWIQIPAGLSEMSYDMMNELYPNEKFDKGIDRNVGLIGIHPNDVKTTEKWEEGRLTLDITHEVMWFDVYWDMVQVDTNLSDEEFYNAYFIEKDEYIKLPELPKEYKGIYQYFNGCDGEIPFDEVEALLKIINDHDYYKIDHGFVSWIA